MIAIPKWIVKLRTDYPPISRYNCSKHPLIFSQPFYVGWQFPLRFFYSYKPWLRSIMCAQWHYCFLQRRINEHILSDKSCWIAMYMTVLWLIIEHTAITLRTLCMVELNECPEHQQTKYTVHPIHDVCLVIAVNYLPENILPWAFEVFKATKEGMHHNASFSRLNIGSRLDEVCIQN